MEYASNSKANTGVTLGAIGTGLGAVNALGGMAGLAGLFGGGVPGNYAAAMAAEDRHVTRHELDLVQELIAEKQRNAILAAGNDTDRKLVEVYAKLETRDKEIRADMDAMRREQEKINRDQAVYNGINTATIGSMKSQIEELLGLTARRIPNNSVCPGWGPVEVTPATPEP